MKDGWYILVYHDVSWEENVFSRGVGGTCPPDILADHLIALSRVGEVVSIADGLSRLKDGNLNAPVFSLWFDDGFLGVRKYALPILERHGITGGISFCSRFVERTELFWRCKLSYLRYVDGLRFLRSNLRKYGYEPGMSIKNFSLDNFSEDIVAVIDQVYCQLATEEIRADAFRLFETREGLLELKDKGWIIANHSAAHYPISEEGVSDLLEKHFNECESVYVDIFGEKSQFWVLPFDRIKHRAPDLLDVLCQPLENRYCVFVGDRINTHENARNNVLHRIYPPICQGQKLINFLHGLRNNA